MTTTPGSSTPHALDSNALVTGATSGIWLVLPDRDVLPPAVFSQIHDQPKTDSFCQLTGLRLNDAA